ncbi:MAG: glutamine--fructose-6-phosphate transaminase (isomerizing) [Dehalococcoidia bacterium]|nr:glutamine--fructose-6-phosphate transaminase (isomerizing) [Dehalococcoidia bacterium]
MCGIMGYVGSRPAGPILIDGLRRLEYRGYDSAGIAVLEENGGLSIHKRAGKLETLASSIADRWPNGHEGIGHTRWATHGKPSDANAHPHADCTGDIVVIHNGIVENYLALKAELAASGHKFASETDTEVLPHLLEHYLREGNNLVGALRKTIGRLEGAHAIVAMSRAEPGTLVAARVGNAGGVVVGYGGGENFLASDLPALLPHTRRVGFLEDREVARITAAGVSYWDREGRPMEKASQEVPYDPVSAAKGNYKHFMLKEIMEQPESILDTIRGRARFDPPAVLLEDVPLSQKRLADIQRVVLVGMGTSLHAAMIGRHYIERIAGIPAEVDNASEYRYRSPIIGPDTLVISVGQSGETVDTLAAMDEAKQHGATQITICNVVGSQATRVADGVVYTRCGLEIGVCSTKTFTASVSALYLLACHLGQARGVIDRERMGGLLEPLARVPYLAGEITKREPEFERLAHQFYRHNNFLYLARGIQYPVAMEGALKLKEISYIHAEGYPAGEMKHGPIALIDREMPVIALALKDEMYDKMMSNIEQVKAREGTVIALASEGDEEIAAKADHVIYVPEAAPLLSPIFTTIPLQLFAYHIAVRRGCDVDQPRNLAKTVTVE